MQTVMTTRQRATALLRSYPPGQVPPSERLMAVSHIMRASYLKLDRQDTHEGFQACLAAGQHAKTFKLAAWIVANGEV